MAIRTNSTNQLILVIRQYFIRLVGLFFILIGGTIAFNVLQSYQIHCQCLDEQSRTCVLSTQKYFLNARDTPLGNLKRASVISKRSEDNVNYNIELHSETQSLRLSSSTTPSYSKAQLVTNAINAYLVGCPTKPLNIPSIQPFWVKVFVLIFPVVGILLVFIPAKITLIFDKSKNQLNIVRTNLFKKHQEIYPLDQIKAVTIQESIGQKGRVMYRVALEFEDDTIVPITTAYDSMWSTKVKMANKIRSFLNLKPKDPLTSKTNITYSMWSLILFVIACIVFLIIFL
ncbi:hypothetical protein [Legionella impletisoli]|uniref:Transmembrane protein n=1 Tax=Legionella impletisoli TaxID=343510 RepID=A0A917JPK1_9GAMM|nr:hypothetical protein [Legionella impletisoli]GGI79336.1 hypothetical protein GCM10007966_04850 [Legionella impletisoli]